MMESKDLGIKLFGKKIHLPVEGEIQEIGGDDLSSQSMREEYDEEVEEGEGEKTEEDCSSKMDTEVSPEDDDEPPPGLDDSTNSEESPESNVNPKTPSIEEENTKSKTEKSQNGTSNNSQEKTLKKPDKILPCPRCNSMDTKFCYYNNYNVNQPRHFCKACQRYWTAGGTMRNVPVGAGRRKNKNSASHYRHITISEALQAARIDTPNEMNFHHQHTHLKSNGRVLSFGLDHHAPLCDSMASALNLTEKKEVNGVTRNGFHGQKTRENGGDDCSNGSTVTVSNSMDESTRHINGFIPPVPCIPGIPWQYQWNTSIPPPPGFYPPGVPMPFYPVWNYAIPNVPWLSPAQQGSKQNPDSPKLGKHSRETDVTSVEDDVEKPEATKPKNGCVLVPKTLRIDDPNEAAKSSIWKTLGIKNDSISGGGLFKGFQPKCNEKSCVNETSKVLHANPAALSRSIKFHESS